jgi:hypothetical protein
MLPLDGSFEKDRLQVRVQKGGQRPIDFEAACEDCTTLIFRRDNARSVKCRPHAHEAWAWHLAGAGWSLKAGGSVAQPRLTE